MPHSSMKRTRRPSQATLSSGGGNRTQTRLQDQNLTCCHYTTPENSTHGTQSVGAAYRPTCLRTYVRMSGPRPTFTEPQVREAVAESSNWTEVMRRLNRCPTGNSRRTVMKYVRLWGISTTHFDPTASKRRARERRRIPLGQILVKGSTYSRRALKQRVYDAGIKERACELCGQGELWRGRRMSLILDHINGVRNDNRLENLRIVCPNCAATLETHCGRKLPRVRACMRCGGGFIPRHSEHRYCSMACGGGGSRPQTGVPAPERRRVERPPYEQLMREIEETSYLAVGRKYGVSDNAIRKWVRFYENGRERDRQGIEAEAA
jgi:hypothetical protein